MYKTTFNEETKVWSGPKVPSLYNPDQNLGQLICRVLEQTPDLITQISADTNVSVTCGEMRDRTLKFARHLSESGYEQGDVIGFIAENSENLAPAVFACFVLGIAVNPLSPIMLESDIIQMYSKTKPKLIICDANILQIVENAVNSMKSDAKIYTVMEKVIDYDCLTEIINKMDSIDNFVYPTIDSNSMAAILCSSGSTGFPKGICKTYKEIIIHFIPKLPHKNISFLQYTPIFWFASIYYLICGALYKCKRIITAEKLTPKSSIDIINKYQISTVISAPVFVVNLLQQNDLKPFESIKHWMIAGSVVTKALCENFKPFIPNGSVSVSYGCTEFNFLAMNNTDRKYGSCGLVSENIELKILSDDGKALDNFEQGEICARNRSPFLGYFDDDDKTKEVFDGELFKTGDIGYFDDEGYLYVVERKKELLKYNNFHITPAEIELIISEIKGVNISSVVGVFDRATSNDIVHAFVIVDESSGLTENFIRDYVNARVIDDKKIRGGVHFVKSLPLGFSGKIDKKEVRKIAEKIYHKNLMLNQ